MDYSGFLRGQEGVAFLDLLLTTNSDIERGSLLLTISALGYLAGCLLCGFLYDKYNDKFIFVLSAMMAGLFTLVIPWCGYLPLMVAIFGIRSFFAGPVDSGSSVICVRMWLSKAEPVLQALQFVFAFGGILAPFITSPFLLHRHADTNNSLQVNHSSILRNTGSQLSTNDNIYVSFHENVSFSPSLYLNSSSGIHERNSQSETRTTQVYIAFLISGGLLMTVTITFTLIVAREILYCRISTSDVKAQQQDEHNNDPMFAKFLGFVLLGINCFSYGCVEKIWMSYLMTFLVELLTWTKTYGSIASAVFWGGFAGGRFAGIFIVKFVRPGSLLIFNFTGQIMTFIVLVFIFRLPEAIIWIFIVLVGALIAPVFATTIYWIDQNFVPLTGKLMAYIYVCLFSGTMTHMVLLGYLFEEITPMWFVYLSLIHAILGSVSLALLSVVAWKIKQYRASHHLNSDTCVAIVKNNLN